MTDGPTNFGKSALSNYPNVSTRQASGLPTKFTKLIAELKEDRDKTLKNARGRRQQGKQQAFSRIRIFFCIPR